MPITNIDENLCTGCKICVEACIMDVIRFDEKRRKAVIKYPQDCVACNMCASQCPVKAVTMEPMRARPVAKAW